MYDFQSYKDRTRFANLDGLRFISIAMVLWHHTPGLNTDAFVIPTRGFLGVDFFFVLSGYLITTLLLREADRDGSFSLKNFYIRRAIRIIPVYYFVVTCVSAYYVLIAGRTELAELVPYYYLFLSNFLVSDIPTLSPTWSLSVEEQFYLVWPLLLLLTPPRFLLPVGLVLVAVNVLGVVGLLGLKAFAWGPLWIGLPNATYAPLILGALLAYLLNREDGYTALARLLGARWTALAGAGVLLLMMEFFPTDLRGFPNLAIHLTMTAILAALVIREDSIGHRVLQNAAVVRVGAVSYGIYLYHLLALDVATRTLRVLDMSDDFLRMILFWTLAYVVAEISFRTLEAYFQRFRPKPSAPTPVRQG